jgi:Transposase
MTMDHYAGIDVSLEASSVCVVDGAGKIVREAKLASEPAALIGWFATLGLDLARIGLEAGPLSQWLYAAMKQAGLAVELLETRHVRTALQTMPVKTDRNDARGIAQLMRLGWFRPVHCKSLAAQETRAFLTARKLVQSKLYDIEMSLRGILRGFGLKVGPTTPKRFARHLGCGRLCPARGRGVHRAKKTLEGGIDVPRQRPPSNFPRPSGAGFSDSKLPAARCTTTPQLREVSSSMRLTGFATNPFPGGIPNGMRPLERLTGFASNPFPGGIPIGMRPLEPAVWW